MRCPKCKAEGRSMESLEEGLAAWSCRRCGGHWLSSFQYWRWRERQPDPPPSTPPGSLAAASGRDSKEALLCAECGHILRKYRVARQVPFRVDHCSHCGGMWFDTGEWEALRAQGLHTQVHDIFTAVWQRELRLEDARASYEQIYRERFGAAAFQQLLRIREWLDSQPEKAAMCRFLSDPDPFA